MLGAAATESAQRMHAAIASLATMDTEDHLQSAFAECRHINAAYSQSLAQNPSDAKTTEVYDQFVSAFKAAIAGSANTRPAFLRALVEGVCETCMSFSDARVQLWLWKLAARTLAIHYECFSSDTVNVRSTHVAHPCHRVPDQCAHGRNGGNRRPCACQNHGRHPKACRQSANKRPAAQPGTGSSVATAKRG